MGTVRNTLPLGFLWVAGRARLTLALIMAAHLALLLMLGLVRHWGNMSSLNDLGMFDQAVWGTLQGEWFLNSNNIFGERMNFLGWHFNAFLLAFVPFYAIYPAAEWFVIAQAVALTAAAWPIFLLASRIHQSDRTGALWALIYLVNPFLLSAAAWDFHPVTLAVPFIAAALLGVETRNFRLLVLCCLALLTIQEQFGITVAGFGMLWAVRHKHWNGGAFLVALGVLHTALVLGVIMPALSPSGSHPMMASGGGKVSLYAWLGHSPGQIMSTIVLHPVNVLYVVFGIFKPSIYLFALAIPLLGLFLAAPIWLLPGAADFAANMLSANPMPRSIISYHTVTLVPILVVASSYGARRLAPSLRRALSIPIAVWVLIFSFALAYVFAPLPLPGARNFWSSVDFFRSPDPAMAAVRAAVGKQASLSAQYNVGAHLSQRSEIYGFPERVNETHAVALWLDSPTTRTKTGDPGQLGTLEHHLQMNPAIYLAAVKCLLDEPGYKVALWRDPWLVLTRGAEGQTAVPAITEKLQSLREKWGITSDEYRAALGKCRQLSNTRTVPTTGP